MRMMLKVLANAITFSGYLAATVVGHAQTELGVAPIGQPKHLGANSVPATTGAPDGRDLTQ